MLRESTILVSGGFHLWILRFRAYTHLIFGSGSGTGLLILGCERTKEKLAALQDAQEKPEAVRSDANIDM